MILVYCFFQKWPFLLSTICLALWKTRGDVGVSVSLSHHEVHEIPLWTDN
ncbi:hypothetical protein P3S67_019117 [Capsicum chacoense]